VARKSRKDVQFLVPGYPIMMYAWYALRKVNLMAMVLPRMVVAVVACLGVNGVKRVSVGHMLGAKEAVEAKEACLR
jgi:hypothetical protein